MVDKLNAGAEVRVVEVIKDQNKISGLVLPWYKISYKKGGQDTFGYVWGGTLSISQMKRGNMKFVYGLESKVSNASSTHFMLGIRAVKGGQLVSSITQRITDTPTDASLQADTKGLTAFENMFIIASHAEANGAYSTNHYIGWTGSQLAYLESTSSTADVDMHKSEKLLFPENGTPTNTFIKIAWTGENTDAAKETESYDKEKFKTRIYKWTGTKVELQSQNW